MVSMTKYITSILLLFTGLHLSAQLSSFQVYSHDRAPFFLVVNGTQVNPQPAANLKVSGLRPSTFQIQVVFANHMHRQIEMVLDIPPGREITYALIQNRAGQFDPAFVSEVAIGYFPPVPQTTVSTIYNGPLNIGNPSGEPIHPADNPPPVNQWPEPVPVPAVSAPPTLSPLPNYNGPIGCDLPMDAEAFQDAKRSISSKTFESSKMTLAKQIIRSNCFLASQVSSLVSLFTYESDKLDIAKFAYPQTYDQGNYYKVNDAFEFESSIGKLDDFINGR